MLRYFDGVQFAGQIDAPTHVSVALIDDTCPPTTAFGTYNVICATKSMQVWPYNAHEGGKASDEHDPLEPFPRELV
ncbi:cephalosporin-C deacetylase-like acetyl esterase [Microbacterium sp. AK009]|uniref:acetylxylan esterase n=1 Tax=Microbacterium sp. AK009 TaxID=2723068 RepID=UPI0018087560|nr:cephalosporin-C deacetylase-like acetyl esterase [Microbacterium sp. AK009]